MGVGHIFSLMFGGGKDPKANKLGTPSTINGVPISGPGSPFGSPGSDAPDPNAPKPPTPPDAKADAANAAAAAGVQATKARRKGAGDTLLTGRAGPTADITPNPSTAPKTLLGKY